MATVPSSACWVPPEVIFRAVGLNTHVPIVYVCVGGERRDSYLLLCTLYRTLLCTYVGVRRGEGDTKLCHNNYLLCMLLPYVFPSTIDSSIAGISSGTSNERARFCDWIQSNGNEKSTYSKQIRNTVNISVGPLYGAIYSRTHCNISQSA